MTQPARQEHAGRRLAALLLVSALVHGALFWLAHHTPRKEPPKKKREPVVVVLREPPPAVAKPPTPEAPVPMPPTPPVRRADRPPVPRPSTPTPIPTPSPPELTPTPLVEATPPPPATPPGPIAPPRGPSAPEPGRLRLFDPDVIGRSLRATAPPTPSAPEPRGGGSLFAPDSPATEQARINARLRDQLDEAVANANVSAGFVSACDDGLDNNIDGEIDCADPGCRTLSVCDTTGVYEDNLPLGVPDGGGPITRYLQSHQEGRVRKLSVRIDVLHGRPGDLALTLVAPDGQRAVLRVPDSDQAFKKAYYVRPFIGLPASGRWTLEVEDRVSGVRGALRGWRLYLTS